MLTENGMSYNKEEFNDEEYAGNGYSDNDRYTEAFAKYKLETDCASVAKSVEIIRKSLGKPEKKELETILSCLDYTSLKPTDSEETILKMTEKVNDFFSNRPDIQPFAAICIYPCYAGTVSSALEIEGIKVACVSGGFPSSQTPTEIKIAETAMAVHEGADEIDIVLPVGRFLSGEYEYIADEIGELKAVCGEKNLKVILESGIMPTLSDVKKAAIFAMYCGADFIKTSTGKESVGATPEAFFTMCKAIREYADETGTKVGIKAAGGIAEVEDAYLYYSIAKQVLGEEWCNRSLLRIGASRLAGKLIAAITDGAAEF